jgi:hypothetical protein
MKSHVIRSPRFVIGIFAALLFFAASAQAGPPLICHTIEIGHAKSLPWISHSWNLSGNETYDLKNLASDTITILNSNDSVLVHMETLRRATLYASKDQQVAKELLLRLHARATNADNTGHPDAMTWFDAGYLAEAYNQWKWIAKESQNPAAGLDGYALVKKAITLRGNDPQMEFAAALITLGGPENEHREHVSKAVAGAKTDVLLAQNLSSHFIGANGKTIAEIFAETRTAKKQN